MVTSIVDMIIYESLKELVETTPNDQELGKAIRHLVKKIREDHEKKR